MAEDSQTFQRESEDKAPGVSERTNTPPPSETTKMVDRASPGRQPEDRAPASWNRFYVVLTGKTNGAHKSVVKTFKSLGQTEVWSPEEADYCLVFCPVVSKVGRDVSEALDHLLSDKEAVLVVMHHTFNKEQVIPPSRRLVEDQRVKLTLDCLFYKDKLLDCKFNKNMKTNIKKFFKGSKSKESKIRQHAESSYHHQNDEKDKKIQELQSKLKQQEALRVDSQSSGGSVPPVRGGEPGTLELQGASSLQVEDGTNTKDNKKEPNIRQLADSSDLDKKEVIALKEELAKLKSEMETLQTQNNNKDKRIQELQKEVSELKQQVATFQSGDGNKKAASNPFLKIWKHITKSEENDSGPFVKPGSSGGSVPPVRGGEPGTVEPQGVSSLQVEDGTKKLSSMETLQVNPTDFAKKQTPKDFGNEEMEGKDTRDEENERKVPTEQKEFTGTSAASQSRAASANPVDKSLESNDSVNKDKKTKEKKDGQTKSSDGSLPAAGEGECRTSL